MLYQAQPRGGQPSNYVDSARGTPILSLATAARLLPAKQAPNVYPLQHLRSLGVLMESEPAQQTARSKMLKVRLEGKCKNILLAPDNGEPTRCSVRMELDHSVSRTFRLYDIQLLIPAEFATLLEIGLPLSLTLEQNGG